MSEAFAQGDWVRALWSEMVLGLSPHEWRGTKRGATSHIGHGLKGQLRSLAQLKQSAPVKTREVPLIWQFFGKRPIQTTDVLAVD